MYQLQYIKLRNIGTLKAIDYSFINGKSQIIQGRNLDNRGQKNNGAGKSFFIDSIGFAITGLVLSGRSIDEFIRDDEQEAYIELSAKTKDKARDLLIKRYLSRKKAQLIEVYINGKPQHKDEHDVNSRNQFIISEIGISRDDLFQFFLISKDRYNPYFKLSDTEKKNITGRFSNSDVVDGVFPLVDADISSQEAVKRNIEDSIIKLEAQLGIYTSNLADIAEKERDEFKEQLRSDYAEQLSYMEQEKKRKQDELELKAEMIKVFEQSVEESREKIKNNFSNIEEFDKFIKNLSSQLDELQEEQRKATAELQKEISAIEEKKVKLRGEKLKAEKSRNEVIVFMNNINNKLQSSISCPACDHEFILDSADSVDELKKSLDELKDVLSVIELELNSKDEELKKLDGEITSIEAEIKKLKDASKAEVDRVNDELLSKIKSKKLLESNEATLKQELRIAEEGIIKSSSAITKLKGDIIIIDSNIATNLRLTAAIDDDSSLEADKKKYEKLISDAEAELEMKKLELNKTIEELRRLNEWALKFKSFKSYLANLSLKKIESLINFYLSKMDTDLSVEIDGYKQKGKKITEKITESILRNGIRVGSYNRFSGGEKTRIDVGSILANQTLINNNAAPRGLDLIIIDEVLESSDSLGIENIIKSMDNIDKTMLLITQNEINSLPERTITFIKQNGETTLQYN